MTAEVCVTAACRKVAVATVFAYYWFHVWDKPGYVTVFNKQVTFLKEFQVNRIKIFFDPSLDPKGAGWQIDQSMIAIGSAMSTTQEPPCDRESSQFWRP